MHTPKIPIPTGRIHILLVDDHPVTRAGTRMLLEAAYPNCTCQEAANLSEARRLISQGLWSLMILDQNLPDGNGLEFLKSTPRPPPTLLMTMFEEPGLKMSAIRAGAKGFVSKSSTPTRILSAISLILSGETSFSNTTETAMSKTQNLSPQEEQVLDGMLAGKRLAEIAKELGVSPTTIQTYKNRLFVKFDVSSNIELVKVAIGRGLAFVESKTKRSRQNLA